MGKLSLKAFSAVSQRPVSIIGESFVDGQVVRCKAFCNAISY